MKKVVFFEEPKTSNMKKAKITKSSHVYIGYASTYNVDIFNSSKPALQLKRY